MPVFAMASRTMSPTAPPKAAQIIGLEGEADAGEAQQRHQRRRRHRGRGQQLEAAGAELRKHLRIAAELAGKRGDAEPAGRPGADLLGGFGQADAQGVGFGLVTPSLKSNSAATLAGLARLAAAASADTVPRSVRRVIFVDFIIVFLPSAGRADLALSTEPALSQASPRNQLG